jgi:hypothetical protein
MGNLVDVALSKGAYNAIGWTEIQWTDESAEWMETFFTAASQGLTLEAAMVRADNKVRNLYGNNCSMLSHYTGNGTYLDSTILN